MRILLACEFYHPSVGGVQRVIRELAERLVARGHLVTVATSYLPERHSRELNGVAIAEFEVSGNLVRGLRGDVHGYQKYVLGAGYDVFMVNAAQQWTFDALWPVLDRMTKPKVLIPCGFSGLYEPAYAGYFEQMPEILRKFDHLVFSASEYRDIVFAQAHGMSNLAIVPNGASEREFSVSPDPAFRTRHAIAEEAFVVLTVGSLNGAKGHHELAEAFMRATLSGREAVLILNGNPPAPISWRTRLGPQAIRAMVRRSGGRLLRRLGLRSRPRREPIATLVARINRARPAKRAMLVDLPRPELVQAYLNADLFVFASNIEYSPLVLYEAAAAGLPFLTVPVGNAAEIAEWTGGGVVCPAPRDERGYTRVDPAVLGEHISRLAADPARLAELGRAGRASWLERFTWETIVGQYEAIFARLVSERARAPEPTSPSAL